MSATLTDHRFSDPDWLFERKLDGERCLAYRRGGRVRLLTRNRRDAGRHYPEVVASLAGPPSDGSDGGDYAVDGEVVAFDGHTTSFARLQQRMKQHDPRAARESGVAVYYYLFDVLYAGGYDLRGLPLRERKRIPRRLLPYRDPLRLTTHRNQGGEASWRQACGRGWEGVIAKKASEPYHGGRSTSWLKFTCTRGQELVVCGYTDPQGSRRGFGALLLGYYEGPDLVYAGRVGTGFDERTLTDLGRHLASRQVDQAPVDRDAPACRYRPLGTARAGGPGEVHRVDYYRVAADRMLPYVADRPVAMERYPDDIEGQRLFQKNAPDYFPDWVRTVDVPKQDGTVRQVVCDQAASLVYLAGQACLTPHVFLSRLDRLDHPDQLVFDLDPPDAEHFDAVRRGALVLRALLEDELGLVAYVKTTGSKGLHVHVPLDRSAAFDPVRDFAQQVARRLATGEPDTFTVEQRKAKRGDRVFVDVLRNAYAQTAVAPYAVRARPGAPAARPLTWEQVADDRLRPDQFTLRTTDDWLGDDPWSGMKRHARKLDRAHERLTQTGAASES